MSDLVEFMSKSPRFGLPMLFSGQAQKEFYVNEAHALTDALLHPAIEGEANTPPPDPEEGECWLVGSAPMESWIGQAGALAAFQGGGWLFAKPRDGMRVLDRSANQELRFQAGWQRAIAPTWPDGGNTIDIEARVAIEQLIAALTAGGILPDYGILNGAFNGTFGWSQFLGDGSLTAENDKGILRVTNTYTVWGTSAATIIGKQYQVSADVKSDSGAHYWAVRKADDKFLDTNLVNLIASSESGIVADGQTATFTATSTQTYIALQASGVADTEVHFANIRLQRLT